MTTEKAQPGSLETILRPGQIVAGRYCVDRLIGKGGMAAVWAGKNQRTGKRVALKVILRSFAATPEADEMFRREALAASRVNHPNVVNVFDVVDHEGMTCIVMELLDGEPLGTYLARKGPLSVEEAVALLLPAMRGVAAANAQGIIHRDLKPQNIFICIGSDGRVLTTKVLDFGISVMVEKASGGETVVTTHGTPAYMSPEHIMNAPDIDERADVYGFGVLLFETLTGHLPFSGEPSPALLMRILNEPAPKASLFRPDLRPEVVELITRAMATDPNHRFSTVEELVGALEDHFLPVVPLPRSLTPMVGVPLFEQPITGAGGAEPVAQLVRRPESLQQAGESEPRQLFVLSADSAAVGESSRRTSPGRRAVRSPETTVELVLEDLMAVQRFEGRLPLLAGAAAFVAALLLVGWLAMFRHRERAVAAPGLASASVTVAPTAVPKVTSVSVAPTVSPPPEPTPSPATMVATPDADDSPQPPAAVAEAPRPALRSSAARSRSKAKHSSEPEPVCLPPALAPAPVREPGPPKLPPRAGTLSAEDF
jgi:serine/threonine-protein kinase